jgi:hypothetical protein
LFMGKPVAPISDEDFAQIAAVAQASAQAALDRKYNLTDGTQVAAAPVMLLQQVVQKTMIDIGVGGAAGSPGYQAHPQNPGDGLEQLIPPRPTPSGAPPLVVPEIDVPNLEQLIPPDSRLCRRGLATTFFRSPTLQSWVAT